MDQIAIPPSDPERADDRAALQKLHPGNRFRLMFGKPFLDQSNYDQMTPEQRFVHDCNNPANQH